MNKAFWILLLVFLVSAPNAFAQIKFQEGDFIPADLQQLIPSGTQLFDYYEGDMNVDGTKDYLFVVAKINPTIRGTDDMVLFVATRNKDGVLTIVKSNDKFISYLGDSYDGARLSYDGDETDKKSFFIGTFGGVTYSYVFTYSRIDKTWQLVKIHSADSFPYISAAGDDMMGVNYIDYTPKDFGKIDIADFDPEKTLKEMEKLNRSPIKLQ